MADRLRPLRDGAVLGAALALMLDSLIGHVGSIWLFAGAAAVHVRSRGMRPELTAAALAALIANGFLLPGTHAQSLLTPMALALLVMYTLEGMLAGALISVFYGRRARSETDRVEIPRRPAPASQDRGRYRLLMESSDQSRERFRLLVEGIQDHAIIMLDPEGRIVSWSGGAERVLGYPKDEVVGRHVSCLYLPEEIRRGQPEHELRLALAEGRCEGEGWRLHKNGARPWIQFGLTTLRDEAGGLRGFAAVMRDLSERRQAEEALRRAHDELEARVRERTAELAQANDALHAEIVERTLAEEALRNQSRVLRSILDSLPSAVIVADRDEQILLTNPAAERMFRFDPAESTCPGWWRRAVSFSTDGASPLLRDELPLTRALRGEEVDDVEVFVRHAWVPNGLWVSITGRPLSDSGGLHCGGLIICHDITERKHGAEDLKKAKEAAEAASRAKDQFLAVLSHELRTPLNPVLLEVSALLDEHQAETIPAAGDLRPSLEMIRRNIELEAHLIDDLLDVARATCGRLSLDLKSVDFHAAIHQSLAVCRPEIRSAGLTLNLELTAVEHHVKADPARLQQLLWNLIKNAVKFTPRGGALAIRTRDEVDAGGRPGGRLVLEVADTGIGIEPDVLPRIFDPFEQGDSSLRRRYGGLGLGLAISRSVAEAHGGRLTARSAGKDRGTTFTLELTTEPAPTPPIPAPQPRLQEPSGSQSLRILLVEDNKDTLRTLAWILGSWRHTVRTAADLTSARALAAAETFDLLLSDIELPDGSGLDLMREFRSASSIPGIAMSGFGSDEDIRMSADAGFATHMTKPIESRKLEKMIQQVCAGL